MKSKVLKCLTVGALVATGACMFSGCSTEGLTQEQVNTLIEAVEQGQNYMDSTLAEVQAQNRLLQEQIEIYKHNLELESKIEVVGLKTVYNVGEDLDLSKAFIKHYEDKNKETFKLYKLNSDIISGFDSESAGTKQLTICFNGDYQIIEYNVLDYDYLIKYLAKNLEKNDNIVYNGMLFDFKNNIAYYESDSYLGMYGITVYNWLEYDETTGALVHFMDRKSDSYTTPNKHVYEIEVINDMTLAEYFLAGYNTTINAKDTATNNDVLVNYGYLTNYSKLPYYEMGAVGQVNHNTQFSILENGDIELEIATTCSDESVYNGTVTYLIQDGEITDIHNVGEYARLNNCHLVKSNQTFTIPSKPENVKWFSEDAEIYTLLLNPVVENMQGKVLKVSQGDSMVNIGTIDSPIYFKSFDEYENCDFEEWIVEVNDELFCYYHDITNDTYRKYKQENTYFVSFVESVEVLGEFVSEIEYTEDGFVITVENIEGEISMTVENGLIVHYSETSGQDTFGGIVEYENFEIPQIPTDVDWIETE